MLGLNSGPRTCVASTVLTEPSPEPQDVKKALKTTRGQGDIQTPTPVPVSLCYDCLTGGKVWDPSASLSADPAEGLITLGGALPAHDSRCPEADTGIILRHKVSNQMISAQTWFSHVF